ncbi:MAG: D-alanyl-D-alanine carboxypeptidase [Sphingomonadales bacterium]|jgi:D-alanyl-D-alanine carboxypeptidase (penicillin-binding protein 5/6)|nr:D-alanyl-D-alanine carboxypeptidase [Sphingomonadales bacterium]
MKGLTAVLAAALLVVPAGAAAPPFQTAAPTAYMVDLSSGAVLFAKDADRRMPPASMAKMMTTYLAFKLVSEGKFKLTDSFTVRPETWQKWHGPAAGSTMFLSPNETVKVDDLLHGIVTLSGNDACVVLAEGMLGSEEAFVARMNEEAKRIGLTNSHFGTSNGWPDEGRTYVTAKDLAALGMATLRDYPQLYKDFYGKTDFTWGKTMGGGAITQPNRNPLLGKVAGADGIKTGHTEEAGYGFTGSAEQNGRRLVMVVAGIDSFNGRIAESVKFMEWGFKAWEAKPLAPAGKLVGEARVQLGSSADVGLITQNAVAYSVPTGQSGTPKVSIVYQGPIKAPIAKGQHVADLVVKIDGLPDQVTPLLAEDAVSEAGFFGRAWAGLMSFF